MSKYFDKAVNDVSTPVYATSRLDVVELYKEKYGADKWTDHIVKDIIALKARERGDYVQTKKEAQRERNSVRREFEYDKRTGQERYKNTGRVAASTKAKYEALGKNLSPIDRKLKGDSIKIVVTGDQKGNKGRATRHRVIGKNGEITLRGQVAQDWVKEPSWGPIWDAYGFDFGIDDEDGDIDADYSLENVSVSAS